MSAVCFNILALLATSVIRCLLPFSLALPLLTHGISAIVTTVALVVLGSELGDYIVQPCPSETDLGQDMSLVCRLFKSVFTFIVLLVACSLLLVIVDTLACVKLRKERKYTPMTVSEGSLPRRPAASGRSNRKPGQVANILKMRFKKEGHEDEQSIMMDFVSHRIEGASTMRTTSNL